MPWLRRSFLKTGYSQVMPEIRGFPPISGPGAEVLILGSMPGRESLAQQRYYAHPRNAFWPIMCSLFKIRDSGYAQRVEKLAQNKVAVWDVLQTCFRSSSLDSDIDSKTIVTNDFEGFFAGQPHIGHVFFNGAKAEAVYLKQVLPNLQGHASKPLLKRLPSTSPAHASMSVEQKEEAWRVILNLGLE